MQLGDVRLETEAALALYRAAQEGLTNALRHGQAQSLQLSLGAHDSGVRLEVRDDGQGLAPGWLDKTTEDGGHYGLRWLRERVEVLGGRMAIANAAPRGARLEVWLPVATVPAEAAA